MDVEINNKIKLNKALGTTDKGCVWKSTFFSSVPAVSWESINCSITVNQLPLQERLIRDTKCIQKYSRGSSVVQHWTIITELKSSKNPQSGDNSIGTALRTLDYLRAVCLGAPHVHVIGRLRHFADVGAATHLMLVKRKAGDGMRFKSRPESSGPSLVTPPESRSVGGPCHSTNTLPTVDSTGLLTRCEGSSPQTTTKHSVRWPPCWR